jgi:hypothetical protein
VMGRMARGSALRPITRSGCPCACRDEISTLVSLT